MCEGMAVMQRPEEEVGKSVFLKHVDISYK